MSNLIKKETAFKFINSIKNNNKNTLSVTLVGSFSDNLNTKKAGDVDIIIICKKLDKYYFDNCLLQLKKLKKKYFGKKDKLIINSTFGPIKFYKENTIVFHVMIYDLKSHIEHTIKSPFTCYDWERSNIFVGKSLKELCPVYNLQLRDFSEARRNVREYLNDLSKNRISYREYDFKNKKVKLVKKYFKIDDLNSRDFIFHIIKFLLINFIKYQKQKNKIVYKRVIEKKFLEIVKSKIDLQNFNKLKQYKKQKKLLSISEPKKLAIRFINKFENHIKAQNKINKVFFSRHKKTKLNKNIFLGQKLNPNIINHNTSNEFKNLNFNKCYSSPSIRCLQTASIVAEKKKIISDNNLKEIDYGDVEGLNYKELKKQFPHIIKKWSKDKDPKFPNGESLNDVSNRLNNFIKSIMTLNKNNKEMNFIIFTHNVVLRCLIGNIFKIHKSKWYKINIDYFNLMEFELRKNYLLSNIDRNKFHTLFKNFYQK